jgi:hypothetical protein
MLEKTQEYLLKIWKIKLLCPSKDTTVNDSNPSDYSFVKNVNVRFEALTATECNEVF